MRRPNILIFHTDQQHLDALRGKGNSGIQTTNLARLTAQGVNKEC